MVTEMPEQEDDQARREERPYASATGEGAGEGVAEARESAITIEQYEGANTWGDLKGISVRKLAEGLVRIEQRGAVIEERMATKEDLRGMTTKQDLAATKQDLEKAIVNIEDRMVTSQDLEGMVTKQDLNDAMMSILRWNVTLILAGIAIMAGVTIGILQVVIANLPQ